MLPTRLSNWLTGLLAAGLLAGATAVTAQIPPTDTLDIYWIDVEGGSATLIVTPRQESILMDAGWARPDDRDARRVVAAMRDAGVAQLDYFIASHFHTDHTGGLPALAALVPIRHFIDHGDTVEPDQENSREALASYLSVARGQRRIVAPGDRLPLRGLEFTFVSAHGATPERPASASLLGPNPYCADADPGPDDPGENSRSVGYQLSLGAFQFVNLGDLTVNVQHRLACPDNLLGDVDLFQVPHHGNGIAPQLTWAMGPRVAVISNGAHKGGGAEGYRVVADTPGIEDIWQLHLPLDLLGAAPDGLPLHSDAALIANLTDEEDWDGHWVKAMVHPDGRSYTVSNRRTGRSRSYFSK